MKIPNSIRIGGVEYEIRRKEIVRIENNLCYGSIEYAESVINLSECDGGGHQHQCVTLWHEILHGIFNHACLKIENEEEIVEVLAKGIYQVLQDNGRRFFDIVPEERVIELNGEEIARLTKHGVIPVAP